MRVNLEHVKRTLRIQLPRLEQEYGVEALGIFGSYVRSEEQPESDLDLLVAFKRPIGLIRYMALENYLSDLLGLKIDLVMKSALKPRIGERILSEVVYV